MLLAASAVALVITLTAAALVDILNSRSEVPALTASPPSASHRTGPSPTSGAASAPPPTATSTADDTWQQIWATDIDQFSQGTADTRVNNDYLIVYDQKGETHPRLHGYSLSNGIPQEIWSRDRADGLVTLTSSALVTYQGIIDPATGENIDVPWDRQSIVVLATEDTIITCLYRTPTCTGWDLSEGVASLRWGPVDFPGERMPSFSLGVTPLGHPVVEGITVARISNGQNEIPSIAFISLADGQITETRDPSSITFDLIPAADGWLLTHDHKTDRAISSLAPDGTQIESYTARHGFSTLLLSDSGVPTLEQYKAAFSQDNTSWASVSLKCKHKNACSNGQSRVTGGNSDFLPMPVLYLGTTTSRYQNYLIIGRGVSARYGQVRILDLDHNRMVPLPPPLFDHRAKVTIARDGLLIAITESGLAAYAPAQ